jgi:hypothetical protein
MVEVLSLALWSDVELYRDFCVGFGIFPLCCFSDDVLYMEYCRDLGVDSFGCVLPDCVYVVGVPCREFMSGFGSVCSGYHVDDRYYMGGGSGLFRCANLPVSVRDGFHDTRFYGGRLHRGA